MREYATAFQGSRILLTALELDLFTHLGDEGSDSCTVARRAGAAPRPTDRLLNALCAIGLIEKDGERFRHTPASRRLLVRTSPDFMAGLAHTASMWHAWDDLTAVVREGRPANRRAINDRGEDWLEPFIAAMHYRAKSQAPAIAALLPLDGVARILDVGGGSGAFASAIVRRQPGASAVVFDLPNVVELTRRYVGQDGLAERVTAVAGDYLADPLPGGFDLVFLSAVVHSNSGDQNASLIRKCAGALAPGGVVAIVDWVMTPDRVEPAAGAFFAINMLVSTDAGDTFTEHEIRSWLADAGLDAITRVPTGTGPELVLGRRPAGA